MQKPIMSLKQFMLRAEILKLYRGFLRLGKFLNEPPVSKNSATGDVQNLKSSSAGSCSSSSSNNSNLSNPMRTEWNNWVRTEFRLRQASTTDEEMARALIGYGKRQLQEMERSIMLATNLNKPEEVVDKPSLPQEEVDKPKSNKSSRVKSDKKYKAEVVENHDK